MMCLLDLWHISQTSTSPNQSETAVAFTSMKQVSLINRETSPRLVLTTDTAISSSALHPTAQAVSAEKKSSAVNTAANVMVNATVNTPPILSWQSLPPLLTFYTQPRPLTSQTLKVQLPVLPQAYLPAEDR